MQQDTDKNVISLPEPERIGEKSLEQTLAERRSVRHFSEAPLTLKQISQLLWSAQGITGKHGFRSAPSAGALYPLKMYVVSGTITDLSAGVYEYGPLTHSLLLLKKGDLRKELCDAGLSQPAIQNAPVTFLITAIFAKTTAKYGQRGIQYVLMEAGHAGQNILLQANALGLGAVPIGAFKTRRSCG